MKRILAMLLALTMMLGCTAALAEETAEAAPEALLSMVTLSVDRDFVTTYAASMDADGTNTYATLAGAALDALEKVHLYVLCGEDTGAVVLGTEDADLATANYLVDDNGLTLVSNLIPHYALRVTPEELQMLAKQMTASMNLTLNGKQLTAEDAQALAAALMPYAEDLSTWLGSLTEKAEISEDGSTMKLAITTHDAADALEIVAARLRTDEALLPYLQAGIDQQNAQNGTQVTLEEAFAQLDQQVADWRAAEAQVLCNVEIAMTETGLAGRLYNDQGEVTFTMDQDDTGMNVDVKFACQDTEAELIVGLQMGEEQQVVTLSLEIKAQGMDIVLTLADAVSGMGTPDFENYFAIGVDPGLTENNIALIEVSTVYGDQPDAPSLEGLTVLDPFTMTEEEQNALTEDLTGYGLPALLGAVQQALPDQMAVVMQMLTADTAAQ